MSCHGYLLSVEGASLGVLVPIGSSVVVPLALSAASWASMSDCEDALSSWAWISSFEP